MQCNTYSVYKGLSVWLSVCEMVQLGGIFECCSSVMTDETSPLSIGWSAGRSVDQLLLVVPCVYTHMRAHTQHSTQPGRVLCFPAY